MKCKVIECINNADCGILDIIKKHPKDKKDCSYFEDEKDKERKRKRRTNIETGD